MGPIIAPAISAGIQYRDAKKAMGDAYKNLDWRQVQGPTGMPVLLGYDRASGAIYDTGGNPVQVQPQSSNPSTFMPQTGGNPYATPGFAQPRQVTTLYAPPSYQQAPYNIGYSDSTTVTASAPSVEKSGFPSWAWALIGLGALLVLK